MVQVFSAVLTLLGTVIPMFVTNWLLAIVTLTTGILLVWRGHNWKAKQEIFHRPAAGDWRR